MTVACVLRTGGEYTAEWVVKLFRQVQRHAPGHWRFAVLSDTLTVGPWESHILAHNWPGWWSKMELFRPGLFDGPVLYLDLDTLVLSSLAAMEEYTGPLAMLSDFYRPALAQSGVMLWNPGPVSNAIWATWMQDHEGWMARYPGDGQFLHAHTEPDRLQSLFPGMIGSYKADDLAHQKSGHALVCFHGEPKQHNAGGWVQEAWS